MVSVVHSTLHYFFNAVMPVLQVMALARGERGWFCWGVECVIMIGRQFHSAVLDNVRIASIHVATKTT